MPACKGPERPLEKGSRDNGAIAAIYLRACWGARRNIAASSIRTALATTLRVTPQIAQNTLCKIATIASASIDISGRAQI